MSCVTDEGQDDAVGAVMSPQERRCSVGRAVYHHPQHILCVHVVMAYIVMAYVVMACILMAYILMAHISYGLVIGSAIYHHLRHSLCVYASPNPDAKNHTLCIMTMILRMMWRWFRRRT